MCICSASIVGSRLHHMRPMTVTCDELTPKLRPRQPLSHAASVDEVLHTPTSLSTTSARTAVSSLHHTYHIAMSLAS